MENRLFITLLCLPLLGGCLGMDLSEKESVLDPGVTEIAAAAQFKDSDSTIVVTVRSNRSWFAHLNDLDSPIDVKDPGQTVPWGYLSVETHSNLTNTTDETPVTVTFRRNYSQTPVNGVLNIYSCGKVAASIPVRQAGAVYHLSASAPQVTAQCDGDTLSIDIDCNTAWTAEIASGTTADVKLDTAAGFDPSRIRVMFAENFDVSLKSAEIVLKAKDCPDVNVRLTQNKGIPYLYILPESDSIVIGGEKTASFYVRSNVPWTASVKESGLDDFTVVTESGGAGVKSEVRVSFTPNPDSPYTIRRGTVSVSAEGVSGTKEFSFAQRGVFTVSFETPSLFSPEIPTSATGGKRPGMTADSVNTFIYSFRDSSYAVTMSQYMYKSSGLKGLYVFGSGKRPYIKFQGLYGLVPRKLEVSAIKRDDSDGRFWLTGVVRTQDHKLGEDGRTAQAKNLSDYMIVSWDPATTTFVDNLYSFDFDLGFTGRTLSPGEGFVLQFSDQSAAGTPRRTSCFIRRITVKY